MAKQYEHLHVFRKTYIYECMEVCILVWYNRIRKAKSSAHKSL